MVRYKTVWAQNSLKVYPKCIDNIEKNDHLWSFSYIMNISCLNTKSVVYKSKCIDDIEKNDHLWSFIYIMNTFCLNTKSVVSKPKYIKYIGK